MHIPHQNMPYSWRYQTDDGPDRWPTTGRDCPHCCGTGKEPDQRKLGADLRRYRKWHEATLTDVASELGLSKSYISDLELGRRDWRQDLIDRYRAACLEMGRA